MGLFKNVKRSANKTKLMKNLITAMDVYKYEEEKENKSWIEFYDFISNDDILGPIIKYYNADLNSIKELSHMIYSNGYGWEKGNFIPVAAFSFKKPLEYSLEYIQKNEMTYENNINFIFNLMKLL